MMFKALFICLTALALFFILGDDASAQNFNWQNPNLNGPDFPFPGDMPQPGSGSMTNKMQFNWMVFSPRIYLALGFFPLIFGLFEKGLARITLTRGVPEFYFEGDMYNLSTLDAVDIVGGVFDSQGGKPTELMFFSPRKSAQLTNGGTSIYVQPGDVAIFDMNAQLFSHFFQPQNIGLANVDACSILMNEDADDVEMLIFSTSHDFFHYTGPGAPVFLRDEDLGSWDPNTGEIKHFLDGSDLGLYSIDGADVMIEDNGGDDESISIAFSVRIPQWVFPAGGNPFFMNDGDVATISKQLDEVNGWKWNLAFQGTPWHVYSIDALSTEAIIER